MREILRVTWTVMPLRPPEPWRHCGHCNGSRKFLCSEKFRVNAQKKRVDIWLIYRCNDCEESWNLPIIERASVGSMGGSEFSAYMQNDAALATRHAFDLARLRRYAARVETSSDPSVTKSCERTLTRVPEQIEIALVMHQAFQLRLDQFLSRELEVSRSLVARLAAENLLTVSPATRKGVRGVIADGQVVTIGIADAGGEIRAALAQTVLAGRFSGVTFSDVT